MLKYLSQGFNLLGIDSTHLFQLQNINIIDKQSNQLSWALNTSDGFKEEGYKCLRIYLYRFMSWGCLGYEMEGDNTFF